MVVYLGCAVWSYKGWVGDFYPPKSRAADFLSLYSRRLTTVEGNTTFYAVPEAATVERWASEVSEGFEFCPKLPRDLTHAGALQPQIDGAIAFVERMRGLGDRLGPIFAQLPPSYGPEGFEDLATFLDALPRQEISLALEVRHRAWFEDPHRDRLNELLTQLGVGRVLLDSRPIYSGSDDPQIQSERRKPQLPLQPTLSAPFTLIRLISHPDRAVNPPFLAQWCDRLADWLHRGTRVYFFVHCPIEDYSPAIAREFQQMLEQRQIDVPPLPWNQLDSPPVQLSLF